jgi:hypothetical protein
MHAGAEIDQPIRSFDQRRQNVGREHIYREDARNSGLGLHPPRPAIADARIVDYGVEKATNPHTPVPTAEISTRRTPVRAAGSISLFWSRTRSSFSAIRTIARPQRTTALTRQGEEVRFAFDSLLEGDGFELGPPMGQPSGEARVTMVDARRPPKPLMTFRAEQSRPLTEPLLQESNDAVPRMARRVPVGV